MYLTFMPSFPFPYVVKLSELLEGLEGASSNVVKLEVPFTEVNYVKNKKNFSDAYDWYDYLTQYISVEEE